MAPALTFGKQLAIGFALALAFVVIVGLVAVRNTSALAGASTAVTRTHATLATVDELIDALVDAETGQRGYALTGREDFLTPWVGSSDRARTALAKLRVLTAGNAAHQRRLEEAGPLVELRLEDSARAIQARRTGGIAAALRVIEQQRGKRAMDSLRRVLGELEREERATSTSRALEMERISRVTRDTIVLTTLLAGLGMLLAGAAITRAVTSRIGTSVAGLSTSSFELQTVANQQATGSGQQAASMNEIAATMRDMIESSRQIAGSARNVARIAGETAEAAASGERAVDAADEALTTIQRHMDAIVSHMLELGRKTQQIGAVLDITKELADQTNIVAINATIEAVGAGEQGRRFAAVAEELRKLADRVGESTKEIRPLVEEVRAAANTTVLATEGGAKAVADGTRQFLDLGAAFDQIVSQVAATLEAAREIELSTQQQTTAVEQVHLAIGDAARAARETEASSRQTLQTAKQLSELSRGLSALVRSDAAVGA